MFILLHLKQHIPLWSQQPVPAMATPHLLLLQLRHPPLPRPQHQESILEVDSVVGRLMVCTKTIWRKPPFISAQADSHSSMIVLQTLCSMRDAVAVTGLKTLKPFTLCFNMPCYGHCKILNFIIVYFYFDMN